jgi:hypothetical protein
MSDQLLEVDERTKKKVEIKDIEQKGLLERLEKAVPKEFQPALVFWRSLETTDRFLVAGQIFFTLYLSLGLGGLVPLF